MIAAVLHGVSLLLSTWFIAGGTPAAHGGNGAPTIDGLDADLVALVAQPGGLTAAEVALRAKETSFEVRGRIEEVRAAAAEVDRAVQGFLPRLSVLGRYTRLSSLETPTLGHVVAAPSLSAGPVPRDSPLVNVPLRFPILANQTFVQVNLTVPVSDYLFRTAPQVAVARHGRAAAEKEVERARRTAALQAKMTYFAWVRSQFQRVVVLQTLRQAEAHRASVKAALDVQRASQADLLQADARVSETGLLVARTQHLVDATERQLRTQLHDQTRVLRIGDRFDPEPPRSSMSTAALEARALEQRVELRLLDEQIAVLVNERRVTRSAALPRLDLFGDAYLANPHPRVIPPQARWQESWDIGVQISYALNDLPGASTRASAVTARQAALQHQRTALVDIIGNEVNEAVRNLKDADAALAATGPRLQAAREALRVRRLLFDAGEASAVEVIDGETELLQSRLERVAALVDRRVAEARLAHAAGDDW